MDGPAEAVLANVRESLQAAQDLGCPSLIVLAGNAEADRAAQERRLVENLKRAAELAEKAGVTLNLEALNSLVDHPGYSVDTSAQGFRIVREAGSEAVKLLFDVYHMQVMEGNLIPTLTANLDAIGHVHVADTPGRHQPGTGEINYAMVLRALRESGYQGYAGLEFEPTVPSKEAALEALALIRGETTWKSQKTSSF
jgi:hydroxypyruvate isomerase